MNKAGPPTSDDYGVSIDMVRQFLALAREFGLPVDDALASEAINMAPMPGEPALISVKEIERILHIGYRLMDDPLPGLYFVRGQIGALFGLAGFLVQTCSTVGAMFQVVAQAESLLGNVGITELRHHPGEVRMVWDCRFTDPWVRWHAADFILAVYTRLIASAARQDIRILRSVHFQHPAPKDPALLQRYVEMFGCHVCFDQTENRLIMPSAVLDLPLPSADPQLNEVLKLHAQKVLDERNRSSSLVDVARSALHQLLQRGEASRENLAAAMHMSGRTLHRKLRDADTSYRELLDELRLERARTLLRDTPLTVHEVAELSGFDEHNSFTRWFRQLTGLAPTEFRQQHIPDSH